MQGRYIPAIIMLVAGLIASIICLVKKMAIIKSLSTILAVLIIFLILGLIARKLIVMTLSEKREVVDEDVASETETKENLEDENNMLGS